MIEAFEIASVLKLTDQITPQLLKVSEKFTALQEQIIKTQEGMTLLARSGRELGAVNTEVRALATTAGTLSRDMGKAAVNTAKLSERLETVRSGGLDRALVSTHDLSDSLTMATTRAATLRRELRSVGNVRMGTAAGVASMAGVAGGASGSPVGAAQMMGATLGYGAYRNGRPGPTPASGGGGRHGGSFHGPRAHFGPHGFGMGSMGVGGGDYMPGLMAIGGGIVGYHLLKGPYEQAKELAKAQGDFKTLNLTPTEEKEAFDKAREMAASIKGTTITGAMKTIHDLHTAFGDLHHALSAAPEFIKSEFVMKAMANGNEHAAEGAAYNLAKAMEHRPGLMNDPARFQREIGMFMQAYMYTRGQFNPRQLFQVQQTGKVAYAMMDADFLYRQFAAYATSKSGSTAGTAASSTLQALIGGTMQERAAGWLYSHGLWQMGQGAPAILKEQAKHNPALGTVVKQMEKSLRYNGGIVDSDLFIRNAYQWTMKYMLPAVEKDIGRKMNLTNPGDLLAFDQKVMHSGLTKVVSGYIVDLVNESVRNDKEKKGMDKNMTFEQARQMYLQNPVGAEIAAQASWKNFLTVIGTVYLPKVTDGLLRLSGVLDRLTKWAEANPGKVKALTTAFAGLSAALLFGGTVSLLTVAFKGLAGALGFSAAGGAAGVTKTAWSVRLLSGALGLLATPLGALLATLTAAGFAGYKAHEAYKQWQKDSAATEAGAAARHAGREALNRQLVAVGQPALGKNEDTANGQKRLDIVRGSMAHGWQPQRPALVQPGGHQKVSLHVPVHLDGRQIAEVVTEHQVRGANRPQAGTSGFDGSAGMAPAAFA